MKTKQSTKKGNNGSSKKVKTAPAKDVEDLYVPKLEKESEIKEKDIFISDAEKKVNKKNQKVKNVSNKRREKMESLKKSY